MTAITDWSVLRGSVTAQRRDVGLAGLLLSGHKAFEALVPVLVGVVIDEAVTTGDPQALALWLLVLGADFATLSLCYRYGARRAWQADVRADQRMRLMLAERVLDPHGGADAGRLPGSLASIATSDAKRVGVANFALPMGLAAVLAMVVAMVALLRISLPLGLLILLGTPPLLYVVHLLGKPLERRSGPEQERAAQASGVAADLLSGIRVLKGLVPRPPPSGATPGSAVRRSPRHCGRPGRSPGAAARCWRRTGCSSRWSRWSAGGWPPTGRSASADSSRPSGWRSSSSARSRPSAG